GGDSYTDHLWSGGQAVGRDSVDIDHDLLMRFLLRVSLDGRAGEEDVHVVGPFTAEAVRTAMPEGGFVIAGFASKPRSRGTVRLRSADPTDAPRIVLSYFADPRDLDALMRSCELIYELYATPSMPKVADPAACP